MTIILNAIFNAFWRSSGGDRIILECSRRGAQRGVVVNIFTVERGHHFCKKYSARLGNFKNGPHKRST
jgi:hypothetical protein